MQRTSIGSRDISIEGCSRAAQGRHLFKSWTSAYPVCEIIPTNVTGICSRLRCHTMTSYESSTAPSASTSGKTKWKKNTKQIIQHSYYPQQQIQLHPPQMYFNNAYSSTYPDPRSHIIQPQFDQFFYTPHPAPPTYLSQNLYHRPQLQSPAHTQPRSFLTITHFNYQPMSYQHNTTHQPPTTTTLTQMDHRFCTDNYCVLNPPPNHTNPPIEKWTVPKIVEEDTSLVKKNDFHSDSSSSFEYTVMPEKIVSDICDDDDSDEIIPDATELVGIKDEEFTKLIVDGCVIAENIAVRNRHRPCFKNIKHLCNRTKTEILKSSSTISNIHSHGIPWATKDFIFAFVRIINSWYILKGYLDDSGNLGKIDASLTEEFKNSYERWHVANKDIVQHLINIFTNLDSGITKQNAEIYNSFQSLNKQFLEQNTSKSQNFNPPNSNCDKEQIYYNDIPDDEQHPDVYRLKTMYQDSDKKSVGYMNPGSYYFPVKTCSSISDKSDLPNNDSDVTLVPDDYQHETKKSEYDVQSVSTQTREDETWRKALETFTPFIKLVMQRTENEIEAQTQSESKNAQDRNNKNTEAWINDHSFDNYLDENIEEIFLNVSGKDKGSVVGDGKKKLSFPAVRQLGMSTLTLGKFENIIKALWNMQFAKYVTFEAHAENIPDYLKIISKPMFLCKVMENLKQNKYCYPSQVVHDLRKIIRNSELYLQKRPNWWFDKCLIGFSKELEMQLSEKFPSEDFSSITGDPSQSPRFDKEGTLI